MRIEQFLNDASDAANEIGDFTGEVQIRINGKYYFVNGFEVMYDTEGSYMVIEGTENEGI